MAFLVARHSDKTQERSLHIVVPLCFGLVGFIIAMSTEVLAARYVALFLMAQSYAAFVVLYAWYVARHSSVRPSVALPQTDLSFPRPGSPTFSRVLR